MNIINILRKLGIIRFGSVSGKYKNFKDRPDELMYDNVFDKKKDLMSKEDYKKVTKVLESKSKLLFKILFGLATFLMLCFLLIVGLKLLFIIALIIWALYFFFVKRYQKGLIKIAIIWLILMFVGLIIMTFMLLGMASPENKEGKNSSTSQNKQCSDNEIHSKKVASGETIYWKCGVKNYANNKGSNSELVIQVAENNAMYPYNGKVGLATVNENRFYCMNYVIKGKPEKKSYCSSFSDYSSKVITNAAAIENFNKANSGSTPWFMPYDQNAIYGSVYINLNNIDSGIEDIEKLVIYPFQMINNKSDQEQAPEKYKAIKTIELGN